MKKFYSLIAVAALSLTAQAQTVLLNETFDTYEGKGGNDGEWSGTAASGTQISDGLDATTGFTYSRAYTGSASVKLGTGSAAGVATTPALTGLDGKAVLTFRAGAWNSSSEKTILLLEITGGGELDQQQVTLTKGAFNSYSVQISGGTSESKITFRASAAASNRFFLDDIKVVSEGSLGTIDYTEASKAVANTLWTNTASFNVKDQANVEVYNINGQLVKSFQVKGTQTVNVSDLVKGVYVVKTTSNGKTSTQKVVKK
ncbi:T9SS type A sorting domain-containing protein [Chishuiella changwenlii]|uniref:T9SS type A sorting domain-containing protein n=1 Tax=Chishuiella changwenlii TaxID=1434701 RepID=UPI002FD95B8A